MEKGNGMEQTILLIDDDALTLRIARKMFEGLYRMDAVQSGEEALTYLNAHMPDLILLDLHMPEMSGLQVLEKIHDMEGVGDIPVIFLTADNDRQTEVELFKAGAMDYIQKPFAAEVVIRRISRILELYHYQHSLQAEVDFLLSKSKAVRRKH